MKYYEYKIDSDKIEFLNSFYGKETVLLNGVKISEKSSIMGAEHFFKIDNNEILLKTDYKLFKDRKFDLDLFKNKQLIDSKRIELDKRYRLFTIGAVGILIGYWLIKLYISI